MCLGATAINQKNFLNELHESDDSARDQVSGAYEQHLGAQVVSVKGSSAPVPGTWGERFCSLVLPPAPPSSVPHPVMAWASSLQFNMLKK